MIIEKEIFDGTEFANLFYDWFYSDSYHIPFDVLEELYDNEVIWDENSNVDFNHIIDVLKYDIAVYCADKNNPNDKFLSINDFIDDYIEVIESSLDAFEDTFDRKKFMTDIDYRTSVCADLDFVAYVSEAGDIVVWKNC